MVAIFREVWRVLRDDGTLWLNLGDTYATPKEGTTLGTGKGAIVRPGYIEQRKQKFKKERPPGLKPKDLCGIPWRLALALQADGWWLRDAIIWAKAEINEDNNLAGSVMPGSQEDRCTSAYEYVFMLSKSAKYYWDGIAIKSKSGAWPRNVWRINPESFDGEYCTNCKGYFTGKSKRFIKTFKVIEDGEEVTKRICPHCQSTEHWVAHFATFPQKLVEPCIMAGTSERGACPECGTGWVRILTDIETKARGYQHHENHLKEGNKMTGIPQNGYKPAKTIGWQAACDCNAGDPVPCLVLDPFMGSGTVALVALRAGRKYIGIELNPDYIDMANTRLQPLLRQRRMI